MMRTDDFREKLGSLQQGGYFFHLHTSCTDGHNSVSEYCTYASMKNVSSLFFTEHIRKEPSYSVEFFSSEIERESVNFPGLDIWYGFEARVLPDGTLDLPETLPKGASLIAIACHAFPNDPAAYARSMKKVFSSDITKRFIAVWVHPGYFFVKNSRMPEMGKYLPEMIACAEKNNVLIENNLKYNLPPPKLLAGIDKRHVINGLDAHSTSEIDSLLAKLKN